MVSPRLLPDVLRSAGHGTKVSDHPGFFSALEIFNTRLEEIVAERMAEFRKRNDQLKEPANSTY